MIHRISTLYNMIFSLHAIIPHSIFTNEKSNIKEINFKNLILIWKSNIIPHYVFMNKKSNIKTILFQIILLI